MGLTTRPRSLAERHNIAHFHSGVPTIDSWLRNMTRPNEAGGGPRTHVVCEGDRVVGFYSLAASAVERRRLPSRVGRNMPEPVPVILLGQLAVDTRYQGRSPGVGLLADAVKRALAAADIVGARSMVVQALDEGARSFYARFGFRPFSEREPLMLVLRMSELRAMLES